MIGLPRQLSAKESHSAEDLSLIPRSERFPRGGTGNTL